MKRLLIGAVVLVALAVFGSMKHPHKHLAINSAPPRARSLRGDGKATVEEI